MGIPKYRVRRVFLFAVFTTFILFLKLPIRFSSRNLEDGRKQFHPIDTQPSLQPPPVKVPVNVLGRHRYRPNGLLELNDQGPHPIYELIVGAEKEWEGKLARASKTLDQAVKEYRRRYNRLPPKGFDLWWKYVTKHNVQLPDEYDTIHEDLQPFWGIEPSDLLKIRDKLEETVDSYTLGKNDTIPDVDVLTYAFQEGRYNQLIVGSRDIIKMFRQIQDEIPNFRMTFSPHDSPNRLNDYGVKRSVLDAADSGTYIGRAALPKVTTHGWLMACSPKSLARRRRAVNLDSPPSRPNKKTFIYDHVKSMDPCQNPHLFHQHGQFLSHGMGPSPQHTMFPEFSYCSTALHHNIRFPLPYGWVEDIYPRSDDPEFEDKPDKRLLWRGSNTGMFHSSKTRWRNSHRDYLVAFTNDIEGTLKVVPSYKATDEKIEELEEFKKADVNPAVMDIAFSGRPIACAQDTCELLEKIYPWRLRQSIREAGNYKFVLDMDGNGWSGRFKRLITSNSIIFKSTIYPEWFANRVQPWVHYVPIQIDLTDLHDVLIFFRGDRHGEGAHEDLARKIAVAGREWSKSFWRKEDLIAYMYRLTLEYVRLMSMDREAMTYREDVDNK